MPLLKSGDTHKRATIADSLNPDNGYRGRMERMGVKPRDHMKENVRQLRQAQVKHRIEKEESQRPQKELYKLAQFKDTPSRVFDHVDQSPRETNEEYLVKGSSEKRRLDIASHSRQARAEVERKLKEAENLAIKPRSPRKASVPRADDINYVAPRNHENFIYRNKVTATHMLPPEHTPEVDHSRHNEFGRVPAYLEERKAQWEEQEAERIRNAPDPNCPRGMCIMPESERLDTLRTLRESLRECQNQLERMPFVIETPSMKKKHTDLEFKMKEIEQAIAIFSKPKVYVAAR
jgi:hypothetical protein